MRNIIVKTIGEWSNIDASAMRRCENIMIRDIRFPRNSININHYFPNVENMFIDNSSPLPWLVNQLVNDGRMPNLSRLYVSEDIGKIYVSRHVKVYHLGENRSSENIIAMKNKDQGIYMFGLHIH